MRCNKARQEIIWERHHGAGSVVPFSLQAGNDIFFRFYLTKADIANLAIDEIDFSSGIIRIIQEKTNIPLELQMPKEVSDSMYTHLENS